MKLSRLQKVLLMERKIVEAILTKKTLNQISRDLKVGKRRLRKIKERALAAGYLDATKNLPPFPEALFSSATYQHLTPSSDVDLQLADHKAWIQERLTLGWAPVSVFEELPIKVGRSSFYRFLKRHDLDRIGEAIRWAVPEIIHRPGEALLVDWGKLCSAVNPSTGKKQSLWAFVGVLGYSRYMMVRLMWACDSATTLTALADMFEEMGGVVERLTSDNPKVFCLEASRYEPLLNPVYERFAAHYNTTVECLPPRDPEKKGKVERPMPYVRRLFESFSGDRNDIEACQQFLERKLLIANDRKHGTTLERPIDRFLMEEINTLKSLPNLAYEQEEFHEGTVRKDGHIRFRSKYYSVDEAYKSKKLQVIANQKLVHIYHHGQLLETHSRVWERNQSKSTKPHHLNPWARSMEDVSIYRSRAQNIGPYTDQIITKIIGLGRGFIDFRKVWGILSLDKRYSSERIEEACRLALVSGTYSYRAVCAFVASPYLQSPANDFSTNSDKPCPDKIHRQTNKFVRNVCEYAQFIATQEPRKEEHEQLRKCPATIH